MAIGSAEELPPRIRANPRGYERTPPGFRRTRRIFRRSPPENNFGGSSPDPRGTGRSPRVSARIRAEPRRKVLRRANCQTFCKTVTKGLISLNFYTFHRKDYYKTSSMISNYVSMFVFLRVLYYLLTIKLYANIFQFCPIAYQLLSDSKNSGTYSDVKGLSECKECPEGFSCERGCSSPVVCIAGHFCPNGTGNTLQKCPAGTWR